MLPGDPVLHFKKFCPWLRFVPSADLSVKLHGVTSPRCETSGSSESSRMEPKRLHRMIKL